MKVLVFSDSHNKREKMIDIIKRFKAKNAALNYIIHLGDLVRDAEYLRGIFPDIPVIYIYGNGDFSYNRSDFEKEFEIGGKKFFILHGHTRNINAYNFSLDSLKSIAEQRNCDIILYGHTHIPREDYHDGTYIICPGSVSFDRSGEGRSYCAIDITGDNICAKIIRV
ncbi:MAG: metallophosphoesterase [Oscillospiraceae bacterium]|nr:metallophosphoesterase [Oscillospiraceae bacterium]